MEPNLTPATASKEGSSVACLFIAALFVVLLHAYGRWILLRRRRRRSPDLSLSGEYLRQPRRRAAGGKQNQEKVDGLGARELAKLPEFVCRAAEQQGKSAEYCTVCLGAMEEGKRGRMLPSCDHGFHPGCMHRRVAGVPWHVPRLPNRQRLLLRRRRQRSWWRRLWSSSPSSNLNVWRDDQN